MIKLIKLFKKMYSVKKD